MIEAIAQRTALLGIVFLATSCGGDAEPPEETSAPPDSGIFDAAADDATDAAPEGVTIGICGELEQPVLPGAAIMQYLDTIGTDCHVIGLFLGFSQQQAQSYVDDVTAWTKGFLGCPDTPPVQDYGPAHKLRDLTASDVGILTEYYLDGVVTELDLTPAQADKAHDALIELGAKAVMNKADGYSQDLCTDGGTDGGTRDAAGGGGSGGSGGGGAGGGGGGA